MAAMKITGLEIICFGGVSRRSLRAEEGFAAPDLPAGLVEAFVCFMLYGGETLQAGEAGSDPQAKQAGTLSMLAEDGQQYRIERRESPGEPTALRVFCVSTGKSYRVSRTPGEIFLRMPPERFSAAELLQESAAAAKMRSTAAENPGETGRERDRAWAAAKTLRGEMTRERDTAGDGSPDDEYRRLMAEYESLTAKVAETDAAEALRTEGGEEAAAEKKEALEKELQQRLRKERSLRRQGQFWEDQVLLRRFAKLDVLRAKIEETEAKQYLYIEKATRAGFLPDESYVDELRDAIARMPESPQTPESEALTEATDALYGDDLPAAALPEDEAARETTIRMVAAVEAAGGKYALLDRQKESLRKRRGRSVLAVLLGTLFCAGAAASVMLFTLHWMYGAAMLSASAAALTGMAMALSSRAGWNLTHAELLALVGAEDDGDFRQMMEEYDAAAKALHEQQKAAQSAAEQNRAALEELLVRWDAAGRDPQSVLQAAEKVCEGLARFDEVLHTYESYRTELLEQTHGLDPAQPRSRCQALPPDVLKRADAMELSTLLQQAESISAQLSAYQADTEALRTELAALSAGMSAAASVTPADRARLTELETILSRDVARREVLRLAADRMEAAAKTL